MSQLFFDFYQAHQIDNFREQDFLFLPENNHANQLLNNFFADFTHNNFFKNIIIYGDSCVGKTHLLNIYANKFRCEILNISKFYDFNPFNYFQSKHIYILDDLSHLHDENKILQIINSASEIDARLIMIYRKPKNYEIPDLVSRIKNIPSANIENYCKSNLKIILANILARKQIFLNQKLLDKIIKNLIANTADLVFLSKKIEEISNISGKKLTISNINLDLDFKK